MHDALIFVGAAMIGGLLVDLQKRLSARQQFRAALALLPIGWIMLLAMSAAGPFPWRMGAAAGYGMMLTGMALLALPLFRLGQAKPGQKA